MIYIYMIYCSFRSFRFERARGDPRRAFRPYLGVELRNRGPTFQHFSVLLANVRNPVCPEVAHVGRNCVRGAE